MSTSNTERIHRFYEQFSITDHVLVTINADPDAIACAMALKRMLCRKVVDTDIASINHLSRPDNLAMIRLLDVEMSHISKIDPGKYDKFVIVDSQPHHNLLFSPFQYAVVIDHHEDYPLDVPFKDVRPDYGATATIMTEYLKASKIKPSSKLATALFYAIKADTDNFERNAILPDIRAFHYLFKHADIYLSRIIEHADMRIEYLNNFQEALSGYFLSRNRIYAHIGSVKNPDICVLIADFFMRVNSMTWSIVSGIYEKKLIIIIRNDGRRKHAGDYLNRLFGDFGSAGGHKSMARAEIPLEHLTPLIKIKDESQIVNWIMEKFDFKKHHGRNKK